MAADVDQQVGLGDEGRELVGAHPEVALATVVDDAVAVLESEVLGHAPEALHQVADAVGVLARVRGGEAVDPVALDPESLEPQDVLEPDPHRAAEVRPGARLVRAEHHLGHGDTSVRSGAAVMAVSTSSASTLRASKT